MNESVARLSPLRTAWSVPMVLFAGILASLFFHWPIYSGILVGWLWSALYARTSGHGWKSMASESLRGALRMWMVCVVLLLVGAVVALWMACGTIPLLVSIGSSMLKSGNLVWMSFLLASMLSMIIGSSIATWSVLGPPLMAMAPPYAAAWVAGALLSGGMVGDRGSPMSTSTILMSTTTGISLKQTLRYLNRSAVIPFVAAGCAYAIANHVLVRASSSSPPANLQPHWLLLAPPLLVIGLALLRVPLLYNLVIALVLGLAMTEGYTHASPTVILRTVWLGLSAPEGHHLARIGGVAPMVTAVILIASAGAFQGVTALGGSIDVLTSLWFSRLRRRWTFVLSAYGVCALYAMMVGSQMLSILMSGNTLRSHFERLGLSETRLLQVISDAAELLPALIPWNLLGLQAVVILGVPAGHAIPFAWFIEVSLILSIARLAQACRRHPMHPPQHKKEQAVSPVPSADKHSF